MPLAKEKESGFKRLSIKPLHVKLPGNADPTLWFSTIITEFTDSWTPRWSPTNVYGRMDPVSFYSGTGRELTLGFRVISDSADEAKENMAKIQRLIQYQYPTYKKHTGTGVELLTAPPYFEIKFMNVVGGKVGKNGERKALRGYINGALQINPGFQTKEQSQYFSPGFKDLYFSDVTIVLRMTVLHEKSIGFTSSDFNQGNTYPYGVKGAEPAATAPSPAQNEPASGEAATQGGPGAQSAAGVGAENAARGAITTEEHTARMTIALKTEERENALNHRQSGGLQFRGAGPRQTRDVTGRGWDVMLRPQVTVGLSAKPARTTPLPPPPQPPTPTQLPHEDEGYTGFGRHAADASLPAPGSAEFQALGTSAAEKGIDELAAEIRQMQSELE